MSQGYKITISGDLGSGKSTVTKELIKKFGFEKFSTGEYQRKMADRMGMSTLALNQYAETHPEIDEEIDGRLTEEGRKDGNIIFDSRMAWHFVEKSFKVYMKCDISIAASRVCLDAERGNVEVYSCKDQAEKYIMDRRASELRRYLEKYGVNIMDLNNYDMIVDSSTESAKVIANRIYSKMLKWYGEKEEGK